MKLIDYIKPTELSAVFFQNQKFKAQVHVFLIEIIFKKKNNFPFILSPVINRLITKDSNTIGLHR